MLYTQPVTITSHQSPVEVKVTHRPDIAGGDVVRLEVFQRLCQFLGKALKPQMKEFCESFPDDQYCKEMIGSVTVGPRSTAMFLLQSI